MSNPTCATCRFWEDVLNSGDGDAITSGRYGECRRYAPRATTVGCPEHGEVATKALFPETRNWEWCGEHEPKLEPTDA